MKGFVLGFILMISVLSYSQEKYFSEPIKIPIQLSGSFAELRSNHFHSGIDIKTEGRTGIPVYPAADGYISRIAISPTGFGHALYINHNNQTTTVYGHLESFNDVITKYVKNYQYKNKSFQIDISVPAGMFPVSKNEIVAYSGNTGSSGGPHLHFEIRDQLTQEPLNPLDFNLKVEDNIAPQMSNLRIYPLSDEAHVNGSAQSKSYQLVKYNSAYHIKNNPVIPVFGAIGFGIEVIDYLNGTWSKCGINHLQLKIDGQLYSSINIDRFSFDKTRYLNSLIDYENYIKNYHRFYKLWKDPGNKLDFYSSNKKNGFAELNDNQKHTIEIIVSDSYKNVSTLIFSVLSQKQNLLNKPPKGFQKFYFNQINNFESEGISLTCPVGAFYSDFEFDYDVDFQNANPELFSDIHKVHHNYTPIHDPVKLAIKSKNLPVYLHDKALIVNIDVKSGNKSSIGGNYKNGFIETNIRSFGNFAVSVDTIPPTVRPLSISNKKTLNEAAQIRFKIKDDLSGIKNYKGTIDGNWVLFEYDSKNNLLFYKFDKERFEFNRNHILKLEVSDNKNNSTVYEATFYK